MSPRLSCGTATSHRALPKSEHFVWRLRTWRRWFLRREWRSVVNSFPNDSIASLSPLGNWSGKDDQSISVVVGELENELLYIRLVALEKGFVAVSQKGWEQMSLAQPVCWRADVAACQMTDNLFIVREVDAERQFPFHLKVCSWEIDTRSLSLGFVQSRHFDFIPDGIYIGPWKSRNLRIPSEDFEWHLLDNSSQESLMVASVCSEILITNSLNFALLAGVWHEKDESLMSVLVYIGPFKSRNSRIPSEDSAWHLLHNSLQEGPHCDGRLLWYISHWSLEFLDHLCLDPNIHFHHPILPQCRN